MSEWISVKKELPKISYFESDNPNDPYECYPVLVFCPEKPGIQCVAYLIMNQDEKDVWNYMDYYWVVYIPGVFSIEEVDFDVFTHWMPLPSPPKEES